MGPQLELGGDNKAAARAYLAAADASCRRHRHAAAKRCFFAGLRLLPNDVSDADVVQALQSLGRCAALAPDVADGARELSHWASLPPWSDRAAVRAEANLQLAALLERDGRHVESAYARRAAGRDLAALGYASQYPEEQAAFARALKYCGRHGASFTAGICMGCLSYSYLRSGNWKRSEETARRVVGDRMIPAPSHYVAESLLGSVEDKILHCFKHGGGVPYSEFNRFHEVMAEDSGQTIVSALFEHALHDGFAGLRRHGSRHDVGPPARREDAARGRF